MVPLYYWKSSFNSCFPSFVYGRGTAESLGMFCHRLNATSFNWSGSVGFPLHKIVFMGRALLQRIHPERGGYIYHNKTLKDASHTIHYVKHKDGSQTKRWQSNTKMAVKHKDGGQIYVKKKVVKSVDNYHNLKRCFYCIGCIGCDESQNGHKITSSVKHPTLFCKVKFC